jgi:chaperonin GroEL
VTKRVCFDLEARMAIKRGFDQIARIAQVTLGPRGGVVALEKIAGRDKAPELLSDTGVIARRIVELPGRFENMGAMLARHMAWRMHEEVSDGAAMALVIAQSIIADAAKYIAAGHNVMSLWRGLKALQPHVVARLDDLAQPLEDPERIQSLATALVGNERLGELIEVRNAYGMADDREYVEGMSWDAGWVSPYFANRESSLQATVERPYLLVTDYSLTSAQDLIPVLERVRAAGGKSLVVIAGNIGESALNLMVANNAKGTLRLLGLKAPRYGDMRTGVLDDIAVATGGRYVRKDAGDQISRVTVQDLGRVQTVVCNRATFTLIGTMGSPQAIRERIRELRQTREHLDDKTERQQLDERIGKLLGGTALLHVSGQSKEDRDRRKEVAETALQVVRLGLQGGIVPGGGSAYIAALSALDEVPLSEDEAPARDMMRQALLAPLTCLTRNAGFDPGPVVARVQASPAGWGFDVWRGEVVDMMAANIVDPLPTVRAALVNALSVATMAITTDVLIHRDQEGMPDLNP